MEMINDDILKEIEKQKDRAFNALQEKNSYLGIYRERVLLALTKEEVEEKWIYKEVIEAMKSPNAKRMILSRAVDLKYLKKYMNLAKEKDMSCKLVDGLSYVGDVALVIASDDAIKNQKNPFVISRMDRIRKSGLPSAYYDAIGKKISEKYMKVIKILIPELASEYKVLTFWDKLMGERCPLEEKLGGKVYG